MKRRDLLTAGGLTVGAALLASGQVQAQGKNQGQQPLPKQWEEYYSGGPADVKPLSPGLPNKDYTPVVVPNGETLPFKIVDGVKIIHLIAEKVEHEFAPGLMAHCWGYNGRVNSTVIEAVEGDRIRIYVTNKLDVPTSVHWHGIYLPNGMDGVSGVTQRPIPPGETFKYEWTIRQFGTFMYHSHFDTMTQEGMGLTGMFIIHPRNPTEDQKVDRDFVLISNEYRVDPGTYRPNPNEMTDFNILTFNGRAFPGTEPLVVRQGQRVRIRFGNLSQMDHHPIHLHGYKFKITATDGERIPLSAQWPETTVLVAVGQTRDVEFIADAPGDWIMHCHMTHHIMNQMGHGMPNMIGVETSEIDSQVGAMLPGYMTMGQDGMGAMAYMSMPVPENSIPMSSVQLQFSKSTVGGMFTMVKVREKLDSYDDPGWYDNPKDTVAEAASPHELHRDGIHLGS
ncbi:MAG: copper oxidase [Alphaproteobacteria bacterium]|nr:MAG: copper oxidase [Alphaproteobacteria bacterium]